MDFDDKHGGEGARARGRGRLRRAGELAAPFVVTVSLVGACGDSSGGSSDSSSSDSGDDTYTNPPYTAPDTTGTATEPVATGTGTSGSASSDASISETVNPPFTTGGTDETTGETTSATTDGGTQATTDAGTSDSGATSDSGGGFDPGDDGVQLCGDDYPMDEVTIMNSALNGDTLTLSIGYGGGCEEHDFGLCWDGLFLESEPVQVNLALAHDGMGDACEAYIMEDVALDLSSLKEAYQDAYQTDTGTIMIHVVGLMQPVDYSF